jgi:hypothetical protein
LGSAATVKAIQIRWPSGFVQTLADTKADQILTIKEVVPGAK